MVFRVLRLNTFWNKFFLVTKEGLVLNRVAKWMDFALKRVRVWRPWQHTPTQTSLQVPPPPHRNVYHTKKKHLLQLTRLVSPIVIDKIAAHWNCRTCGTWANLYKVKQILCRRCLLKLGIHFLILYNNNY